MDVFNYVLPLTLYSKPRTWQLNKVTHEGNLTLGSGYSVRVKASNGVGWSDVSVRFTGSPAWHCMTSHVPQFVLCKLKRLQDRSII